FRAGNTEEVAMIRHLLSLGLVLAVVTSGPGQPEGKKGVGALYDHADKLASGKLDVPGVTADQRKVVEKVSVQLAKDLVVLRDIEKKNPKIPEGYQKDLDITMTALERATDRKAELKAEERVKIITVAGKNIAIKRKFAEKND